MTTYALGPPNRQLRISISDEVLQPGVALHQLTLRVSAHGSWLEPTDTSISAAVILEGTVDGGSPSRPLSVIPARVINVRSFPINERLAILLSDDQLLQLEADRGQGDVELQLHLAGTFLDVPPSEYPTWQTQIFHRISAGRWLELLDRAGKLVGVTVRVPSPLTDPASVGGPLRDTDPSLKRASERLREARAALRDGDVSGCIRLCRHVLDNVRLLDPPQSADAVRSTAPKSRTESQRWSSLFHDLYSLASAASHDDEITQNFNWSREDAQAILAATAGLLARVPAVNS